MNKTYYIAVSMELTPHGPEFHMVTDDDPDSFREKYNSLSGEVFVNRKKTVHTLGEMRAPEMSNETVLQGVADAIAEIKKHRGSYMSNKEAEEIFKHLRVIRTEAGG